MRVNPRRKAKAAIDDDEPDEAPVPRLRPICERKPWVATVLTLLVPGLGHLYTGSPKQGLALFTLAFLAYTGFISLAMFGRNPVFFNTVASVLILLFLVAVLLFAIFSARHIARMEAGSYRLRFYNHWYMYLLFIVLAVGLQFYVSSTFETEPIVKFYRIAGGSPDLRTWTEQYVIVDNLTYHFTDPERGDLIVIEDPKRPTDKAKRVVGLPGEKIEIRDKRVWINDRYLPETYIRWNDPTLHPSGAGPLDTMGSMQVPVGAYFVLGDNRDEGLDSRDFGPVPRSSITAKGRVLSLSFDLR